MIKINQRGFMLVEVVLVVFLIGLIMAISLDAFTTGRKAWESFQTRQEAEAAVRYTSMVISNELNYASYLEIRKSTDAWTDTEIKDKDRLIFIHNGNIIIREKIGTNYTDVTVAHVDRSNLELSFSKPADTNVANTYVPNSLFFSIRARDKVRDGVDENGDGVVEKAVIFPSQSAIMLSNMLPNSGVPYSDKSLYSKTTNCTPGDRILYRTAVDRFNPTAPGGGYTCGF